jgi:hypothetical protein
MRYVADFAGLVLRECLPGLLRVAAPESRLLAAEAWLCRAQDMSADGGVSYGYSVKGGWRPSYPETTGYIVPTFLRLAASRDAAYRGRADRAVAWLLSIQNEDGSYANPRYGAQGIVFDTGQVLFGLLAGWHASRDRAMLDAARRAAGWLIAVADDQGCWTRHEHLGVPHAYNTRAAWALLAMNAVEFDARREDVARRNLDWAVACQRRGGLFDHCGFASGDLPTTHTLAYTAQGLLESALLLDETRYLDAAVRCADAVLAHLGADGRLPGTLSPDGDADTASCCLTGNCQFAIVWRRVHATAGGGRYLAAAEQALDYVMGTQDAATDNIDVRGAIKGSQPIWGRYACLSFPNWATKFFVDAMWQRRGWGGGLP